MTGLDSFAIMRNVMVDSQIRPTEVFDLRVIEPMRVLPREAFAPSGSLAYADEDIALGNGRFLLKPIVAARLAQLALEKNPTHALVIGAGSGYLAAILSLAGVDVVALEEESNLTNDALSTYAGKVHAVIGPLHAGWPAGGPYDVIVVDGALTEIPLAFAGQLSAGGRIVTVLADDATAGAVGRAVVAEPASGGYAVIRQFDCTARLLPHFTPAPAFSF